MEIYITTNLINGKVYIGQSRYSDPTYLGSGKLIVKAIRKYGKENFTKKILESILDESLLDSREIFWITFYRKKGFELYNVQDGGRGWSKKVLDEYWRSRREKEHEEILHKIEDIKIEADIERFVAEKRENVIKQRRKSGGGRKKGVKDSVKRNCNHKVSNPITILQYTLDGKLLKEWEDAREAANFLNISYQMISRRARKEEKYKGFIWKKGKTYTKTEYYEQEQRKS